MFEECLKKKETQMKNIESSQLMDVYWNLQNMCRTLKNMLYLAARRWFDSTDFNLNVFVNWFEKKKAASSDTETKD